jgi:hypothetical protein
MLSCFTLFRWHVSAMLARDHHIEATTTLLSVILTIEPTLPCTAWCDSDTFPDLVIQCPVPISIPVVDGRRRRVAYLAECTNVALPLLARAKMNELFFFFEHPTCWFEDRFCRSQPGLWRLPG